ncbi:MAG: DinB family protein [Calditrichaeota bacterium]|nr:MAG: DinB family protein [Calditrichota bacterium]
MSGVNLDSSAQLKKDIDVASETGQIDFLSWYRSFATKTRDKTLSLLNGLNEQDFIWRPRHDARPIAWLLWHIGECEESVLWEYYRQEPIYRFRISCTESPFENLPTKEALLEYLKSVRTAFWAFVDNLSADLLSQPIETTRFSRLPLQDLLLLPIHHEIHHAGQISYIRRLMGKPLPEPVGAKNA